MINKDEDNISVEEFNSKEAFNIDLIFPDKDQVKFLGKVTTGLITENDNDGFHKEGLYSSEIFNIVGSKERNTSFGYIDLQIDIIHPMIYDIIINLSAFYKKIITGKEYAIWDDKEKNFIISDMENGKTGYVFFTSKLMDIKWIKNKSIKRKFKIDLIEKYKKKGVLTYNKLLVLPAGLREYEEDSNGRVVEDEINDLYRACLSVSNMLSNMNLKKDELDMADSTILRLQNNINEVYDYLIKLIDGKKKFINGLWTKRVIDGGTRNVISGIPFEINDLLDDENAITMDDTICGLFQYIKATEPVTMHKVNTIFLSDVFSETSNLTSLISKDSLKTINVELPSKEREKWMTEDGLVNILNKLVDDRVKNSPIEIGGNYLGLIYEKDDIIVYIHDTELMDDFNIKFIRPITYGEMFYIAIYDMINIYPALLTRYPIIGHGSIYPSKIKLQTTDKVKDVKFYNNGRIEGTPKNINKYPNPKFNWMNSMTPHFTKIAGLGADFDG